MMPIAIVIALFAPSPLVRSTPKDLVAGGARGAVRGLVRALEREAYRDRHVPPVQRNIICRTNPLRRECM
jgi:hypothetical protein